MIELGLMDKQIDECIAIYKSQRDAMCQSLYVHLSHDCSFLLPKGGYFVWIKLPDHIESEALCNYILQQHKVFVIKGNRFSLENKSRNFIRLTFAFHGPEILTTAVRALCTGIDEYLCQKRPL
jgi:DNA-binding transcriptional MocR family regulator